MRKEITLPEIAENVETATVIKVLVSEGDSIKEEQAIVEMESDKASFEVPSPHSGTVQEIKVGEGDDVNVGDLLMTIETEGKEKEEQPPQKEEEQKQSKEEPAEQPPEPEEEKKPEQKPAKEEPQPPPAEKKEAEPPPARKEVPAAPSVRRLARELGVDIYQVSGTGPGNRIMAEDVKAHAKEIVSGQAPMAAPGAAQAVKLPDFSQWGEIEREPMNQIRKVTAQNMIQAWQMIPHVNQFDSADVTDLEQFRNRYGKQAEKAGGKLTITAILLKVAAKALQRFPKFNASLDMQKQEIIYKKYIHIGVAVDTERGLLVPVIKDVDQKSLIDLSVELSELAQKARDKKITPKELQGGNFSISNLGGIGGTNFTPIVYPPQVAVLGVSRATVQPVFIDEDFQARLIVPLSLSYDHRIIDGAEGARFLRWICDVLENPFVLLLEGVADNMR